MRPPVLVLRYLAPSSRWQYGRNERRDSPPRVKSEMQRGPSERWKRGECSFLRSVDNDEGTYLVVRVEIERTRGRIIPPCVS
jgi:hypothetical protein